MSGQCGYCGGWHTAPNVCPAVPNNAGASQPLADWRDVEIDRLRRELAEAEALLREARDDYGLGMNLGGRIDAFLAEKP